MNNDHNLNRIVSNLQPLVMISGFFEQKIERERKKQEQNRYGEATLSSESDDAFGQFLIETLENAAWAHKTVTDIRKEAEQRHNK